MLLNLLRSYVLNMLLCRGREGKGEGWEGEPGEVLKFGFGRDVLP